jgi:hypothetical protein
VSSPTDTHGTGYDCACRSRDARECFALRYGPRHFVDERNYAVDERCECSCHRWDDEDDLGTPC